MSLSSYWLIILLIIIAFMSLKTLRDDERLVIFRLGRFFKIVGPGLVLMIPLIDKGVKINLSKEIPGWQGLSKDELDMRIKNAVMSKST
jgi:regulator of protease activity HflC (stomatin/prohibitin superfamily)